MKRTTVFVDEALEYDLKALAKRRGRPVASVVREALAAYVIAEKQAGATSLSFLGVGASGHHDTADRHEELLWREHGMRGGDAPVAGTTRRRRRGGSRKAGRNRGKR